MGSPWQGAGGYHGFDGDNKASLMTFNLLGSVDDSEKLSFIDWNKIGDSSGKELLNSWDDSGFYIGMKNSYGFYAYKIDKAQYLKIMMIIKINNKFCIMITIMFEIK